MVRGRAKGEGVREGGGRRGGGKVGEGEGKEKGAGEVRSDRKRGIN